MMLPYTQLEAAQARDDEIEPENRRWIAEDLTPITRREGLRRTKDYVTKGLTILGDERTGDALWVWSHFYECKHYDPATKQCGNYENRPPICSGYPWYGQQVDNSKALPSECSFRADQGTPVTIMDKLNRRRLA